MPVGQKDLKIKSENPKRLLQTMTILDVFKSRIQVAERILITTHEYPDADGIGSEISLCLALRQLGKKVFCVNEEPLLDRYQYLDEDKVVLGFKNYLQKMPDFKPDLIIVVDTNTKLRVGTQLGNYITDDMSVLYIDHHPVRGRDLSNHCIDVKAAATGQLIGEMIEHIGVKFTKKIALPIYTSIIIDTSSFRYPTVSAATHRLVSKLMDTGINPPEAYNGIYGTKRVPHMHLLGRILSTASTNKDESIAWLLLRKEDIDLYGSDVEDTHAFINNLLVLNNIKVACMFRDDGDSVKMSLRSSGEYDVGMIAQRIGGGGHSHSAATILPKTKGESVDEVIQRAIKHVEKILKEIDSTN